MKKIILFLATFLTFSCSESFLDIDPKAELFPGTFYSNEQELEMAVVALYQILQTTYVYGYASSYATGGRDKTSNFANFEEVDIFATEGDNTEMSSYWSYSWMAINAANELINRYQSANAPENTKKLAAAQAHFIRAYSYFMLVRAYNRLPLIKSSLELSTDLTLHEPGEIYELIIEDLKFAEANLPATWAGDSKKNGVGWTAGAAKSLLAYVYLSMTGYPLHDTSKYALAAAKAKEVIDNEATYGYGLMENIADLYSAQYNWQNKACKEVVLAFFSDNGYGCVLCSVPGEYGGWEVYKADLNFFLSYPEGPRKDAIFIWKFPMADGTVLDYSELRSKRPWYRQYWDGKIDWEKPWVPMNWKNSRPLVAITHANTLLVYAEAQAMAAAPDASTYDAINRVRIRAGLPELTPGLSQEAFRDSVVRERQWEFPGGFFCTDPWYDLVRLERVEESVKERHHTENQLVNNPTKANYFSPYPSNDVLKNPNLK